VDKIMLSSDKLGEIRFPVTASFTGAVVVGVLTVCFWMATNSFEKTVLFVAAAAAAAGVILGALYSARSLTLTAAALDREEARARRTLAFQFTSKWNDPAMFHVRDVVRDVFNTDHRDPQFNDKLKAKETNVIHFLNFLEEVGIAIEKGGADPTILQEAFGGVVVTAWSKLQNWVRECRQTRGRAKIWAYVEELARKWN
jgi:hypothetical protein